MIQVYLEGHAYKHDLFELIRVFFPGRQINFVEKEKRGKCKYLIESILTEKSGNFFKITNLYKDSQLIKTIREEINDKMYKGLDRESLIKLRIKRGVYLILSSSLDIDLPWGILTGIRPVKLVHDFYEKEMENKIRYILEKEYKLDETRVELLLQVAAIQKQHIYPLDQDRYSLYIGIPFCPTRCSYCSFPSYALAGKTYKAQPYIDTLIYEINSIKDLMAGKKINTVYIGGGTPTAVSRKQLESVIESVQTGFNGEIKEFTVEAGRPDTIDRDMLKMLRDKGVTRISINPQTMNGDTLKLIGRNHSPKSIIRAYNLAKSVGFDIINMDIILGLPGETPEDLQYTLERIEELDPENLTIHILSLKRGSKLYNAGYKHIGKVNAEIEEMLDLTKEFTYKMNLLPYYLYRQKQILGNLENVGYAKRGMECVYNIAMMEEKETVIGLGLGSVSKIFYPKENRIQRVPNFKGLDDYIRRVDELIARKKHYII